MNIFRKITISFAFVFIGFFSYNSIQAQNLFTNDLKIDEQKLDTLSQKYSNKFGIRKTTVKFYLKKYAQYFDLKVASNNLETVEDLKITVDSGDILLNWEISDDSSIARYKIYYGTKSVRHTSNTAYEKEIGLRFGDYDGEYKFLDKSLLQPKTRYYFAVKAIDGSGNESLNYSNEVSIFVNEKDTNSINFLELKTDGLSIKKHQEIDNEVVLHWNKIESGIEKIRYYKIYYTSTAGIEHNGNDVFYYGSRYNNSIISDNAPLEYVFRNLNPGEHTFEVAAVNEYREESKKSDTISFTVANYDSNQNNPIQSIELKAGWNLISLNVNPENTNVRDVFSELIEEGTLSQVKNITESFNPNLESFLNTLKNIEGGEGYQVKVAKNTVLNIYNGSKVSLPHTYNLNSGWNFVGNPLRDKHNMFCYYSELRGSLESIKKGGNSNEIIMENGFWDQKSLAELIVPGEAYWIKMYKNKNFNAIIPESENPLVCAD